MLLTGSGHYSRKYYRSIFLSDFHIGSKAFDSKALLNFLRHTECRYLYLVGDIIDGWKLSKRWHWDKNCTRILDELINKQENGTKIIYLPGNHDDEIRRIMPLFRHEFSRRIGFQIKDKALHIMADGRQMLVLHGDQFDNKIIRGKVSQLSDRIYDVMMDFLTYNKSRKPQTVMVNGQKKPFSLAKALSKHGQWALYLLSNFEASIYKAAQKYKVDGIIAGHTHIPTLKTIKNIAYANPGCWLHYGHTALIEDEEGMLKIIDWPASIEQPNLFDPLQQCEPENLRLAQPESKMHPKTALLIHMIRKIWPEIPPKQNTARNHQQERIDRPPISRPWITARPDNVTYNTTIATKQQRFSASHSIQNAIRPTNLSTKIFSKIENII